MQISTYAGKVKAKNTNAESAQKLRTNLQQRMGEVRGGGRGGGRGGNWNNSFGALKEDDSYTPAANQISKQKFEKANKEGSDIYYDGHKYYKYDGYNDDKETMTTCPDNYSESSDPSSSKQGASVAPRMNVV